MSFIEYLILAREHDTTGKTDFFLDNMAQKIGLEGLFTYEESFSCALQRQSYREGGGEFSAAYV